MSDMILVNAPEQGLARREFKAELYAQFLAFLDVKERTADTYKKRSSVYSRTSQKKESASQHD